MGNCVGESNSARTCPVVAKPFHGIAGPRLCERLGQSWGNLSRLVSIDGMDLDGARDRLTRLATYRAWDRARLVRLAHHQRRPVDSERPGSRVIRLAAGGRR